MNGIFSIWNRNRKYCANFLKYSSVEELNKIPTGFNNNMVWNIGHIIAAQQSLIYKKSGMDMIISQEFFNQYKAGTKPERKIEEKEIADMESLLWKCVEQTMSDYENNAFTNYTGWTSDTKFEIDSIETALIFNNYHEGLHMGYMMSIRKFISE